jgi:hypothetical protein
MSNIECLSYLTHLSEKAFAVAPFIAMPGHFTTTGHSKSIGALPDFFVQFFSNKRNAWFFFLAILPVGRYRQDCDVGIKVDTMISSGAYVFELEHHRKQVIVYLDSAFDLLDFAL